MTSEVKIEADSNDITEHAHDDRPRPYLCTVCDKRFAAKQHLKQHKQTHNVDKVYSCTQCEKRFATQRYLRQHMNVHSSKYKCTECEKCFGRYQHTDEFTWERNHICVQCVKKRFTTKRNLKCHKQIRTGALLFSCTLCKKRFSTKHYLNKHINVHSCKYKCTECGKCFSNSGVLSGHRRIHSGENDCAVCSKRFNRSGDLAQHSIIHSGEKSYKCPECDKAFSRFAHLTTHI